MNLSNGHILRTSFCQGNNHDFKLYKRFRLPILQETIIYADSGYAGIQTLHTASKIPHKSTKLHKLTKEQKQENRQQRKERIGIEHLFSFIKRFKIFAVAYRNHRKRFALRFNLFAAIFNVDSHT